VTPSNEELADAVYRAQRAGFPKVCTTCYVGVDDLGIGNHEADCSHPAAGCSSLLDLASRLAPLEGDRVLHGVQYGGLEAFARAAADGPDPRAGVLAVWVLALLPVYEAARRVRDLHEEGAFDAAELGSEEALEALAETLR
jgi:hypothetical protein